MEKKPVYFQEKVNVLGDKVTAVLSLQLLRQGLSEQWTWL